MKCTINCYDCIPFFPFVMMMMMMMIIINIKLNYNYDKKFSQNPLSQFLKKLYYFDNFIRRRLSDHKEVTFAIKYLPMIDLM